MAVKLKKLNPEARSFEAGGKEYFIETQLSISRFHQYQIYEKEAGFGMSFKDMFSNLIKMREELNKVKFVDCAVRLDNLINGMAKLEEKEHTLLKMCALFMNTKDEDRGDINDDMITAKIDNWKNEYEVNGFFTLALNTVNGFFTIYKEMHQSISAALGEQKP